MIGRGAFHSRSVDRPGPSLEEAESAFLRGYREEYPYTQEMEQLRPLLGRFEALHTYAKLIRCVAEKYPGEPDWMAGLRGRLAAVTAQKSEIILRAE